MKWITTDTTFDGLPLYLRRPDFENIWAYQNRFPNLFCVTHDLEKVTQNGLPESDYNKSLDDFDHELVNLFDYNNDGLIILVETFGGNRNYWFYIATSADYTIKIENIKKKFPSNIINIECNPDVGWGFLEEYPVKLYNKK